MNGEYFSVCKFVMYLFYSLIHAIIIYFLCFQLVAGPDMQADGKGLGLWIPGHVVYGTCVLVVNLMLVMRFNNYTGWGEMLAYWMVLFFFTHMSMQSKAGLVLGPDLYYVF